MKITDNCSMRDKRIEKKLRDMELLIDKVDASNTLSKTDFTMILVSTLELFIDIYRITEDNTTVGKTLLEYTGVEVKDACFRVGAAKNFSEDHNYVIAVMQELGK